MSRIEYKGFLLEFKKNLHPNGYRIVENREGFMVYDGWIVTKGGCNAMPGATWFRSEARAKHGVDCLLLAGGQPSGFDSTGKYYRNPNYDNKKFWELVRQPQGYLTEIGEIA